VLLVRLLETADWARNRALLSRVCADVCAADDARRPNGDDARYHKTRPFAALFPMARPGLEPGTPRFSGLGQPALTRSAERSKKWLFAGSFGTPSAVAADGAVHRDTCGYARIPVGLCRDAGVGGTNPRRRLDALVVLGGCGISLWPACLDTRSYRRIPAGLGQRLGRWPNLQPPPAGAR
jgi:hypothetical protein